MTFDGLVCLSVLCRAQSKLGGGGLCDTGTSTLGEKGCAVMMERMV